MVAIAVSLGGIYFAWLIYGQKKITRDWLSGKVPFAYNVLYHKYYVDELYQKTVVPATVGFGFFWRYFDNFVIDGLVHFCAAVIAAIGGLARRLQSGQVQAYGAIAFVGAVIVIVIIAVSGGYFQ
ncbi:hypothetical protein KBTX_04442 [wastewater metagenome]|uniref:NADH-quinone oxidoreductase subunit L n=2 Tax=unclassified sequences TaxID=12908 RepID=A0A5B8RKA4_9ZZZZ|nr:hypothetical protein KBTEX_04442 [uncultured organism]